MNELSVISVPTTEWNEVKATLSNLSQQMTILVAKDQSELMTVEEAREMLKVGGTTIERYIKAGQLNVERLNDNPKGKRYIRRSEIEQRLNDGLV
ncbi:MAG: helix-turn-helix domain-containing protein [Rikenellaceae bacterium]